MVHSDSLALLLFLNGIIIYTIVKKLKQLDYVEFIRWVWP